MSFLGKGLQLVVTPAVLSVAVPGMLHHLKKKITIQLIRSPDLVCDPATNTKKGGEKGGEGKVESRRRRNTFVSSNSCT